MSVPSHLWFSGGLSLHLIIKKIVSLSGIGSISDGSRATYSTGSESVAAVSADSNGFRFPRMTLLVRPTYIRRTSNT